MKQKRIVVSICVLTFNHEKYISNALDGFFKQKVNFNYEILIHDDCSTDKTQEIITEYQSRYPTIIKPIFQKTNKYSQGIRAINCRYNYPRAKGKYIAICDGDDFWEDPLKLQSQVDFLERNEDFVLTFQNSIEINEDGQLQDPPSLERFRKDRSSLELKQGVYVFTSTICFRNKIKEFPEEIFSVVNEDTFVVSLLGEYGRAKSLNYLKPAYYRIQSHGVWSTLNNEQRLQVRMKTYENLLKYYTKIGCWDMIIFYKKKLSYVSLGLLNSSLKKKQFSNAIRNLKNAYENSNESFLRFASVAFGVAINSISYKKKLRNFRSIFYT